MALMVYICLNVWQICFTIYFLYIITNISIHAYTHLNSRAALSLFLSSIALSTSFGMSVKIILVAPMRATVMSYGSH